MVRGFGPYLEIARIQSEINRLFDNLLDLGSPGKDSAGLWIPNMDILETEDSLVVKVDLPGVDRENLTISSIGGNLIIKGEKKRPDPEDPATFHLAERAYGRFRR